MTHPASCEIRILIVDDHAMFRAGITELLGKTEDIAVMGACATAAEALAVLPVAQPMVVLLDFDLGSGRAFDFLEGATAAGSTARILILTAGVSEAEAVKLVKCGVAGILHKQNTPEELVDTIRKVANGEVCMEKHYLKPLFRSLDETRPVARNLTERDKAILRMVFQGLANKEIGGKLEISEGAVKSALRHLFQKLGVRTRAQLVKVALEEYRDQL